jgi:hypothetical protein
MALVGIMRSAKYGRMRRLVFLLVATMGILGIIPQIGGAGMVPAGEASKAAAMRQDNLAKVQGTLERKEVAARLSDFGLTPAEVQARIVQLNDQQVSEICAQIDQVNPGGDGADSAAHALGFLVGLALVALVVYLVIHKAGKEKHPSPGKAPSAG